MTDASPSVAKHLRIGLLGVANISKKNAIAILEEPSGCCISAVASRSQEKADSFVKEFLTPRLSSNNKEEAENIILSFGGSSAYDDLIQSSSVDALYIPIPSALHKKWVLKALGAGKHVLLEKPVAPTTEDFEEMLAAAKEHNKYLQDGTMFVHHPRTSKFVQAAQNTSVMGDLKRVEGAFGFCGGGNFFQDNVRVKKDADPLGCIGDLGWYVVRMALLVMEEWNPTSAQAVDYQLNDEGVPIDATCLVKFQENKTLSFHCSFTVLFRNFVHVIGTKSWASMDDFILPKQHPVKYEIQSMSLTDYDLMTEHVSQAEEFDGPVQEVLMWKNFARLARAIDSAPQGWQGDSEECHEALKLVQISTMNQKVMDALMTSIRNGGTKVEIQ